MLGKPVADFSLPSTGGSTFKLYFYPKFRDAYAAFREADSA